MLRLYARQPGGWFYCICRIQRISTQKITVNMTHQDSCQVVCFFIGPGGYRLLQHADNQHYRPFCHPPGCLKIFATQYLSGRVRAPVATMFILPTEEMLTSNYRPGTVCRRKVRWRSSSPLRESPPLTGPRTAMPFDRHTVPGLLLYVDIERRLEVPAETRGHP